MEFAKWQYCIIKIKKHIKIIVFCTVTNNSNDKRLRYCYNCCKNVVFYTNFFKNNLMLAFNVSKVMHSSFFPFLFVLLFILFFIFFYFYFTFFFYPKLICKIKMSFGLRWRMTSFAIMTNLLSQNNDCIFCIVCISI